MVQGVKFVRKAQVAGELGKHHVEYVHPAPEADDEAIRQWIKTYSAYLDDSSYKNLTCIHYLINPVQ